MAQMVGFILFPWVSAECLLVDEEIAGNLLGLATLGDTVDGQFSQVVGMVETLYSFCTTITMVSNFQIRQSTYIDIVHVPFPMPIKFMRLVYIYHAFWLMNYIYHSHGSVMGYELHRHLSTCKRPVCNL